MHDYVKNLAKVVRAAREEAHLFVQLMLLEIDGLLLWQPELPSQDFLHSHALQFTSVLVYTTG